MRCVIKSVTIIGIPVQSPWGLPEGSSAICTDQLLAHHWLKAVTGITNTLASLFALWKVWAYPYSQNKMPQGKDRWLHLSSLQHVDICTREIMVKLWSICCILPLASSFCQVTHFSGGSQSQILNKKRSTTGVPLAPAIVPDGTFVPKAIIYFHPLHPLPLILYSYHPRLLLLRADVACAVKWPKTLFLSMWSKLCIFMGIRVTFFFFFQYSNSFCPLTPQHEDTKLTRQLAKALGIRRRKI